MRLLVLVLAACGASAPSTTPVQTITTQELAVGCEVGLVDVDGSLFIFDRDQVTISRGGATVSRTEAPGKTGWTGAAALVGPQGARWAVGISANGLWRVTAFGELEAIGARLGIDDARAVSIASRGSAFVVGLTDGVAISRDGKHVMRIPGDEARRVAMSDDRVAVATRGRVDVLDLARATKQSFAIDDVDVLGFLETDDTLVVASRGDVYLEQERKLRRVPTPADVSNVAVSGTRVWMVAGRSLFVRTGQSLAKARGSLATKARVFSDGDGDVWVAQPRQLVRHTLDNQSVASWRTEVEPTFQRVCADCHGPDGESDLDLSSVERWREHRSTLQHVLEAGSMPPPDVDMHMNERQQLLQWLGAR